MKNDHLRFLAILMFLVLFSNSIIVSGNQVSSEDVEKSSDIIQSVCRPVLSNFYFTECFGFSMVWTKEALQLTVPAIDAGRAGMIAGVVPPEEAKEEIQNLVDESLEAEISDEEILEEEFDDEYYDDYDDYGDLEYWDEGWEEEYFEEECFEEECGEEFYELGDEIIIESNPEELIIENLGEMGELIVVVTRNGLPLPGKIVSLSSSDTRVSIPESLVTDEFGQIILELSSPQELSVEIESFFIEGEERVSDMSLAVIGNPDSDEDLIPDKTELALRTNIFQKNKISSVIDIPPAGKIYLFPPTPGSGLVKIAGYNLDYGSVKAINTRTSEEFNENIVNKNFVIYARAQAKDVFTFEFN